MAPATVGATEGMTERTGSSAATLLDTGDMQGIIGRGYGHLPFARYLLLGISNPVGARAWLGAIAGHVTTAAAHGDSLKGPCLNVAFTAPGLARLGLTATDIATLSVPMQEGMVTDHRSRILGDNGVNDPTAWRWGTPSTPEIHLVLMIFASTQEMLESAHADQRSKFEAGGALVEVGEPIDGRVLSPQGTEHFGFADGISQPVLKGWPFGRRSQRPPADPQPVKWSEINPGEVVFGYEDNFSETSQGPTVAASTDPTNLLPVTTWDENGSHHLGYDGTLLVIRQLAQDVLGFHQFVRSAAASISNSSAVPVESSQAGGAQAEALLGAKLVGRWPNGAPIVLAPEHDDQAAVGANDFGYSDLDPDGLHCPFGAHVRRSNPRDTTADKPATALASTKTHRILRRGRSYGLPIVDPPTQPGEEPSAERGLVFVCINADIERQFEEVQHNWLGNPFFDGLYGEVDPLTGVRPTGGIFTEPADPIRRKVTGMPTFVTVKGGAYCFLPGIRALRYLASLT
jgi:Dyp-type peroxidase family